MILILWIIAAVVVVFGIVVFRGAPYVPSHGKDVERAFTELFSLDSHDVVVDIGSGDGLILRRVATHGAQAIGYELNPILVLVARLSTRKYGARTQVILADFWLVLLPAATTVVYGFVVSRDIPKLARKMQAEADRLGHPLHLILYGMEIPGMPYLRQVGAHNLYYFKPLQLHEA